MKTLYIECGMGAAGDMLSAALLELVDDRQAMIDRINSLGIPGLVMVAEPSIKCSLAGTHVRMLINGEEEHCEDYSEHLHNHEEHEHEHEHHHHHDHEHHHRSISEICEMIDGFNISDSAKSNAKSIYKLIAEAESRVHGTSTDEVHFHEVGAIDAVADVTTACLLMEELAVDKVVCSPICLGSGKVRCAHGFVPVPAPATAEILKGIPTYAGAIESELCTPTGAAILRQFTDEFVSMPNMKVDRIGYGMGSKDFEVANCVRVMLGETTDQAGDGYVVKLECTIDDMTGEDYSYAVCKLLGGGALDVYTTPVMMKKGRPGQLMTVLAKPEKRDEVVKLIFRHTTTIGMREQEMKRYTLDKEAVQFDTKYGPVKGKISSGYGVRKFKIEHDELERIADETGLSIDQIRNDIMKDVVLD